MKIIYDVCRKYCGFNSIARRYCHLSRNLGLNGNSNLQSIEKQYLRCFATIVDDNLSEKLVKNFLNHATNVYEGREKDKSEIGDILKNQEVKELMNERIHILENINSLEELGKFFYIVVNENSIGKIEGNAF